MNDFMHVSGLLSTDEQKEIYRQAFEIQPPFYVPETKWGKKMNLKMNCLGWHWNAKTYKYEKMRSDYDKLPCAPIPPFYQEIAKRIMEQTKYWDDTYLPYDICICNWYEEDGKLGVHQDNSESKSSLVLGYPVLSISIGADCNFVVGGTDRKDPMEQITLRSGDVVLFGRTRRLAFHGVTKLFKETTPSELGIPSGRLNLTFRIL